MQNTNVESQSIWGALSTALKSFCMLFINGITVANEAVGMADKAVRSARTKQAIEVGIGMSDFANIAVQRASVEQAKARADVEAYIGNDPARKAAVMEAQARLKAVVEAELAELAIRRSQNR